MNLETFLSELKNRISQYPDLEYLNKWDFSKWYDNQRKEFINLIDAR